MTYHPQSYKSPIQKGETTFLAISYRETLKRTTDPRVRQQLRDAISREMAKLDKSKNLMK